MCARNRTEGEDQRDEPGARRRRVLQELEADVIRRQPLGGDAGADDDRDEQAGSDGFGARAAEQVAVGQQHAFPAATVSPSSTTAQQVAPVSGSTVRS